jgi:hypothetical protein
VAAPLVLVHSPLVGPATWDLVAPLLARDGQQVLIPDLRPAVAAGPPYIAGQVDAIARSAGGRPAVLIGHSGAGRLLAPAGQALGGVLGYIFVDAGLPAPGRSSMQTMPADLAAQLRQLADARGWLPPWPDWWGEDGLAELIVDTAARRRFAAGCPRLPLAMLDEVSPGTPGWPDAPAAYLRLSEAYDDEAVRARALGWPVAKLRSHHLATITDPGLVADSLRGLLETMRPPASSAGRRGIKE